MRIETGLRRQISLGPPQWAAYARLRDTYLAFIKTAHFRSGTLDPSAIAFGRLIGPLRRASLLRNRTAANLPDLPESHTVLLRALAESGPISARDAAAKVGIAPSTLSNLLHTLAGVGLVLRKPSPSDHRVATLTLSPKARFVLERYDLACAAQMSQAMAQLTPDQRLAIASALPALQALLGILESPFLK